MKGQATERLRVSVNDAMDVHGGKAVIEGPQNYLGPLYRAVPVGITVEGANIVTRALIQFGQGAIRSHPYILKEVLALEDTDPARGLDAFDQAFWGHVGHALLTALRATGRAWSFGIVAPAPSAGEATGYFKQLGRYAAAFALAVDMALLTLGGALKRKEMISGRFADILCELYLLSATLKRWHDEGRRDADFPLVAYCCESGLATIAARLDEILANLPNRPVAWLLRAMTMPFGRQHRGPSDRLATACAQILLEPSATRDRVTVGLYHPTDDGPVARLDRAFKLAVAAQPLRDRMRKAHVRDVETARAQGLINESEAAQLAALAKAVADVINVDDFAPEELTRHGGVSSTISPANAA
jgi:acyl-CoA dehydrogenase